MTDFTKISHLKDALTRAEEITNTPGISPAEFWAAFMAIEPLKSMIHDVENCPKLFPEWDCDEWQQLDGEVQETGAEMRAAEAREWDWD